MTLQGLLAINVTAAEWHREMDRLAAVAQQGPNPGQIRRLRELEELLDYLWQRRRRALARWFALSLGAHVEQAVPRPASACYQVSYREYQRLGLW